MRKVLLSLAFVLLTSFSMPALAGQCPGDMAKIDAALATGPSLSATDLNKVMKFRAKGEKQHKSGDHGGSVKSLAKAMDLLGL